MENKEDQYTGDVFISSSAMSVINAVAKTSMGGHLLFRKKSGHVVATKYESESQTTYMSMEFGNSSISFPGDKIAFSDVSYFMQSASNLGYLGEMSPNISLVRKPVRHSDALYIVNDNNKSRISFALANSEAFKDSNGMRGCEKDIKIEKMLAASCLSYKLSNDDIKDLVKIANISRSNESFDIVKNDTGCMLKFYGVSSSYDKDISDIVEYQSMADSMTAPVPMSYNIMQYAAAVKSDAEFRVIAGRASKSLLMTTEIPDREESIRVVFVQGSFAKTGSTKRFSE